MKVKLQIKSLIDSLKVLSKIKDSNYINFSVEENMATLIKENDNTAMILKIQGYECEKGRMIFPCETVELIKNFKNGVITISDNGIKTDDRSIKIEKSVTNFKSNSFLIADEVFRTTERELLRMLEVKYAMAKDEIRPILCGVCFNGNETCAIDGYRLSLRKGKYNSDVCFVLNKDTVTILDSILDSKLDREVTVLYDEKLEKAAFKIDNIEVIGSTLSGEFIKYISIIPDEHRVITEIEVSKIKSELDFIKNIETTPLKLSISESKLILVTDQCKRVLDTAASIKKTEELQENEHKSYVEKYKEWKQKKISAEKSNKKFGMKEPKEKIIRNQVVYKNVPIAQIKSQVDCNAKFHSDDNELDIAVNPKYLIDAIKPYKDKLRLKMNTSISPIVITEDSENLELVLPIRIKEEN